MLINISETKLFKMEDSNIRVSCISKNPFFCTSENFNNTWLSTINKLLGKEISESTDSFVLRVHNRRKELLTNIAGNEIAKTIVEKFEPSSIRIDLSIHDEVVSFVILLKDDII